MPMSLYSTRSLESEMAFPERPVEFLKCGMDPAERGDKVRAGIQEFHDLSHYPVSDFGIDSSHRYDSEKAVLVRDKMAGGILPGIRVE